MAPRRGSGGGDVTINTGSGGSSSSSSQCGYAGNGAYPCTTPFRNLYIYSKSESYGQLIVYAIYSAALLLVLFEIVKKTKARRLQVAIASILISFVFLCVRYGLLIADNDILVGYRFESSIVVLLQRIGIVVLFAAAFHELVRDPRKLYRGVFYLVVAAYGAVNVAYIILDFVVSGQTFSHFKDEWHWHLSDRDFALVYTPEQIDMLKVNRYASRTTLSPYYVEDLSFDYGASYIPTRNTQIKVGLAADYLAFALVALLAMMVAGVRARRKIGSPVSGFIYPLIAIVGLLISTVFTLIVTTRFVFHNWKIVSDFGRWARWIAQYDLSNSPWTITAAPGFLQGYRTTVNGFPVAQAVIQPFGIVLACAAIANVAWVRARRERAIASSTS